MRSGGKMNSLPITMNIAWKKRKEESEVTQCPTFCDPMDHGLPGSFIHGILRARVLEGVAISFSRGSFWPRSWTGVSWIASRLFTVWATRESIFHIAWTCSSNRALPSSLVCFVHIHWRMTFPPDQGILSRPTGLFPCSRITRRCTTMMTALTTASAHASG